MREGVFPGKSYFIPVGIGSRCLQLLLKEIFLIVKHKLEAVLHHDPFILQVPDVSRLLCGNLKIAEQSILSGINSDRAVIPRLPHDDNSPLRPVRKTDGEGLLPGNLLPELCLFV